MKRMPSVIVTLLLVVAMSCKNKSVDTTSTSAEDTVITTTDTIQDIQKENPKENIPEPPDKIPMMEGTVMMKGEAWIIHGTNQLSEMKDYFPSNLSAEFRVEGIRVEFKGVISEIPPNVRMVGVPITLTEIERIK